MELVGGRAKIQETMQWCLYASSCIIDADDTCASHLSNELYLSDIWFLHLYIQIIYDILHGMEQRIYLPTHTWYYVDTSCIDAWLMGEGLFLRATGAALEEQRPLPSLQCLCWCSGSDGKWMEIGWMRILYIYIWAGDMPNHFPLSFQGPRQQGDWWGRKWAKCVLLLFWFWGPDCVAFASSIVYGLKINQSRASSDSRNKKRPFFVTLASPKSSG